MKFHLYLQPLPSWLPPELHLLLRELSKCNTLELSKNQSTPLCSLEEIVFHKTGPDAKRLRTTVLEVGKFYYCCVAGLVFNRLLMNTWIQHILVHKKEQAASGVQRKRVGNPVKKKQVWVLACGTIIASKSESEKQEIFALNPFGRSWQRVLLGALVPLVFLSLSGPFQIKPWIWNRDLPSRCFNTLRTHWEITLCLLGGKANLKVQ